jgi:phosphohistidine phosphatase
MKTLFILRHAKSSWDNHDLADFDRPLNAEGLEAATFMGNLLHEKQIQPDTIISSPAKRAKQTAILVRETAQFEKKIQYEEKVYEASPLTLVQIISAVDDKNESLLLVGHNPGFEGLIKLLTGETLDLPTAGFVTVNLRIDSWTETTAGSGSIESFTSPKSNL